ncbi:MAG: hypothetical protein K0R54_3953 [Clostridiaceae bacterium]|jgi:hypothetical protein|nr:hypothetical protein [Clostridiaceae bacterium]
MKKILKKLVFLTITCIMIFSIISVLPLHEDPPPLGMTSSTTNLTILAGEDPPPLVIRC